MKQPTRLERIVDRNYDTNPIASETGEPMRDLWVKAVVKLLKAEHRAIRRAVRRYRDNAPLHSHGDSLAYRKACDDLLAILKAMGK